MIGGDGGLGPVQADDGENGDIWNVDGLGEVYDVGDKRRSMVVENSTIPSSCYPGVPSG